MEKSIRQLVPMDFRTSPIWKPVDDLEDPELMVEPYTSDFLHLEEMYLVASTITMADGSNWEGYVRFSWGTPMVIAIAINETEFGLFGAERAAETEEDHIRFAEKFNKTEDNVFPIEYKTKVKLYLQSTVY